MSEINPGNRKTSTETFSSPLNKSFRDRSHVIDTSGQRVWIYPQKPSGPYHRRRAWVAALLILFFIVTPFVRVDDHPFFLFDFLNRKFILFGMAFWTQDFYILALSFLALMIFIVLFTAVYGRIFCGWVCPQTVFMEMVFRKIEFLIEGDGIRQKHFNDAPMSGNKFSLRLLKHSVFILISLAVSAGMSFWFFGTDRMIPLYRSGFDGGVSYMLAWLIFAGVFYFIFSRFRENACIFVCPYGRLQSVLIDRRTIVVAYDQVRGEPRSPIGKRVPDQKYGDCVDCGLCRQVCPTGIDIRNGIQLECINCTACIDACNGVMKKVSFPEGLIRYASLEQIAEQAPFRISPRLIGYSAVLMLLIGLVTYLMATRSDVEVILLRAPGSIAQRLPDKRIVNVYTAKIINKTFRDIPVYFSLKDNNGSILLPGREVITVPAEGITETSLLIYLTASVPSKPHRKIYVQVRSGEEVLETVTTQFMEINTLQNQK